MAGRGTVGVVALAVLLGLAAVAQPLLAQATAEVKPLERDPFQQADRYQVTLHVGATLWDVANDYLPLIGLDKGDAAAYQLVEASFQHAFPARKPGALQPDDSFTLEVPPDTFVTERFAREGDAVVYFSFKGDQLTYYPRHPSLLYRLVRHDAPDRAEVSLTGQGGSAVDLAREIYQVDPPDFIQVRMVRAALSDKNARVVVDLSRKYLDDFRNYRDRAVKQEAGEGRLKIYTFGAEQGDVPFPRVEDAIGDETDPGAFPKVFRLAYYRDGTVRKYVLTEPGDTLAQFNRPDTTTWQKILPAVESWQTGVVEPLAPFTPAVNQVGSLIPGRLLVLSFAPRAAAEPAPAPAAGKAAPSGSGLSCLGGPLALLFLGLGGWGLGFRTRRPADR